jgi:glucokinase
VGGGLVLDGKVWRGGRFRGGELGHIIVQAEGVACNCGQTGCLEAYASGTAIARLAREARPGWNADARMVFAAADAGDPAALKVLQHSARFLAAGVVSLTSLLDPDRFVIGGGVATQPRYLRLVREALADPQVAGQRPFDPERLQPAALGEAAGAVGAAGMFLAQ